VSRIFLSHSSRDNRQAIALVQWLSDVRPELATEIFIDIGAETGLRAGQRWKEALRQANDRCEAVICLLSRNWESSTNCKTEYLTAENLGKQILVVRLEELGDTDITTEWQRCDLFAEGPQTEITVSGGDPVRFSTAALDRLKKAIEGTGIGPENFAWPPKDHRQRAPYRGWEPFEVIDAGVFFGRDAAIVRGTDELRAMRISWLKALFVVLGPSGSGKSSFLRAGLIPRLQRDDRHFRVLGIMRPERNALSGDHGFAAAIHTARQALHLSGAPLGEIKNVCLNDPDQVAELLREVRTAAATRLAEAGHHAAAPTLVLPVDQAEELFSADASAEAEQFLALIADLTRWLNTGEIGLIVAATIRTDRYELMQNHAGLDGVGTVLFNELKSMPSGHFSQVITGPAARTSRAGLQLTIAPVLVNRLLDDATEGADTLPLLALTLARLYADFGTSGELTLANYEAMGGMHHVVQNAIDEVLAADAQRRAHQLELLQAAFIPWLATINPDSDLPMRRVARYVDIPEESRSLIDALVDKRLLVKDERGGVVLVEVALESLLRQWDDLAGWLREERQNLIAADDIERSATAWQTYDRNTAWLLTGTRLTDAENLADTAGFSGRLAATGDYILTSRDAENERLAREEEQRQAEVRLARARARFASLVAIIAIVGAIAAVAGFVQATHAKDQADARTREALAIQLTSQGQAILAGVQGGGDVRAVAEVLVAPKIASTTDTIGGMLTAVIARRDTIQSIQTAGTVRSLAFSPDGRRIISGGSDDRTLRLWDAATGLAALPPLVGHTDVVTSVAFSPDGHRIVSGSDDHTVRVWNADTGHQIGAPIIFFSSVNSVAFSPDGHRIVSGSDDKTVLVSDADTGKQLGQPFTGHQSTVSSVAFSPDGHRIVSGSDDKTVLVSDADTGKQLGQPFTGHQSTVSSVAFSPDGHRIVSGSDDKTVLVSDADTGKQLGQPFTGHQGAISSVAFSPDGHRIVSGSDDETVRVWDADTGKQLGQPFTGHQGAVYSVAFSPDGLRIVSGGDDTTVRVRDADIARQFGTPIAGPSGVGKTKVSADGRRIVTIDDNTLQVWDTSGKPVGTPITVPGKSMRVVVSSDARRIASVSYGDDTLRVFDVDTGKEIGTPIRSPGLGSGLALSEDGQRVASLNNDGDILQAFDVDAGEEVGSPIHTSRRYSDLALSPDGRRIVGFGIDPTMMQWDVGSGKEIGASFSGHIGPVRTVAYSRDKRRIISGSDDTTVRVWDADSGKEIGVPLTGPSSVESVAFSPDEQMIASGDDSGTVRLWSVNAGKQIGAPFTGHDGGVMSVAFNPDGHIVSGGEDRTGRLWPGPGAWPELLCDKLITNMSHRQWRDWVSPNISYMTVCPQLPIAPD
jgi:WD40 repeat protein